MLDSEVNALDQYLLKISFFVIKLVKYIFIFNEPALERLFFAIAANGECAGLCPVNLFYLLKFRKFGRLKQLQAENGKRNT